MTRRYALALPFALVCSLAALALGGCGGDEEVPITPEPSAGGGEATPEVAAAAPEAPPGPVAEDETFELRATTGGPYAVGEPSTFQIQLSPRGIYHVNEEYPMSIALEGAGLALPERLEVSDAAEHGAQLARFEVPFTASAAGEHEVTAAVDFVVCTDEACMPETHTLALVVAVQ